jgi:hypothetical protein
VEDVVLGGMALAGLEERARELGFGADDLADGDVELDGAPSGSR